MNSVGRILRSARERQGRAVAEIADELCLTQQYLRAIEEDDVKGLPGTFFYKNFVRQYAAIVGVKDSEIRAGVEALATAADEPVTTGPLVAHPVRPMDPIVADSNRRRFNSSSLSVMGLVVALLVCSAFYSWWTRPAGVVAAKPAQAPAAVQPASQSTPSNQPSTDSTIDPGSQSAPEPDSQPTLSDPVVAVPSAKPSTVPVAVLAEAHTQTIDGINQVVLNVAATEKTWLSITSEGKRIFSGFLEPSQTKTLTGVEAARMTVGNAGGIEVRLNGKPIGPIGKSGQVRVVVFTPDNFEVLPLDPIAQPSETL